MENFSNTVPMDEVTEYAKKLGVLPEFATHIWLLGNPGKETTDTVGLMNEGILPVTQENEKDV